MKMMLDFSVGILEARKQRRYALNFLLKSHLPLEITVQRLFYVFKISVVFALMHCFILKVLSKFALAKIREKKKSGKPEKMKSWGSRYWRRRGGPRVV